MSSNAFSAVPFLPIAFEIAIVLLGGLITFIMYGMRSDMKEIWTHLNNIQNEVHHVQKDVAYISGRFHTHSPWMLRESHGLRGEGQPGDD